MQFRGETVGPAASVTFIIFGGLEVVSGVVGNVLLLSVLFTNRLLGQASCHNIFIANLALTDLLTLGYWMPFFVLDLILGYNPAVNQAHCQVNGFIVCLCTIVSTLTLVSISLNRYLHVCHSRLYRRIFNRTTTTVCCLLLWFIGTAFTVPPFFAHGALGSYYYQYKTHVCAYTPDIYPRVVNVILMAGSTLAIAYFNFAIFRFWRRAKLTLRTGHIAVPRQTCCSCGPRESVSSQDMETERNGGSKETSSDAESNSPTASNTADMSAATLPTEDTETDGPAQWDGTQGPPQADEQGSGPSSRRKTHDVPATTSSAADTGSHSDQGPQGDFRPEAGQLRETGETDSFGGTVFRETKKGISREANKKRGVRESQTFRQELARRQRKQLNRERAFVRSLAVISLLMVICLLPFCIAGVFAQSHPLPAEVAIPLTLLLFVNCSVNWAVYGIMNRSFRQEHTKLIRRIVSKCLPNQDYTAATIQNA